MYYILSDFKYVINQKGYLSNFNRKGESGEGRGGYVYSIKIFRDLRMSGLNTDKMRSGVRTHVFKKKK